MVLEPHRPVRVLQVIGRMVQGGIETWLMHVLRGIDRERFQLDFLVHSTQPGAYDDEIRRLGSRVIPCLGTKQPLLYARNFRRVLAEYGPYDVVHSHVHHYSGWVMTLAALSGVPMRIAHSHNDISEAMKKAGFAKRAYFNLMEMLVRRFVTQGYGCSRLAAASLFGPNWETNPRLQLLYLGIDLSLFGEQPAVSSAVRSELGIAPEAFVIGHVGRFTKQKNHDFWVEIAAEVVKREPRAHFLLIGDGPLRPAIEQKVAQARLQSHFTFAGLRSDVAVLMQQVMDVFLFPSLHEGLPLVGLEAQAAGLPLVMSDTITTEVDRVPPAIHRLSLTQSASTWAETVLQVRDFRSQSPQAEALKILAASPFNIKTNVSRLESLYATACR